VLIRRLEASDQMSGADAGAMANLARITVEERRGKRPTAGPVAAPAAIGEAHFRPESFFVGRTRGGGVVRDPFGRVVRRCSITTEGAFDPHHQSIRFQETFAYDDGEVDVWRWVMGAGGDGRYVAAEALAGAGITGERRGGDYFLRFRRPVGKAKGRLAPRFSTRFTLLAPDLAFKQSKVAMLGVPVGVLTAVHRRIED
jgi:hypothetical protein